MSNYPKPSTETVATSLAQFIHDHKVKKTFRAMLYDYLKLKDQEAYLAGGMTILSKEAYEEYKDMLSK